MRSIDDFSKRVQMISVNLGSSSAISREVKIRKRQVLEAAWNNTYGLCNFLLEKRELGRGFLSLGTQGFRGTNDQETHPREKEEREGRGKIGGISSGSKQKMKMFAKTLGRVPFMTWLLPSIAGLQY